MHYHAVFGFKHHVKEAVIEDMNKGIAEVVSEGRANLKDIPQAFILQGL